jgi:hypothetical protein
MKKQLLGILYGLIATTSVHAADKQQLTEDTRGAIKALGSELKTTLKSAMKAEGPVKAISVCSEQAPGLAKKVSEEQSMEVSRTSLKTRNRLNAPDAWELSVLEQFEQRKSEGESVKTLEYSETVQHNGNQVFRYMKAIPTDDVCLMCHGKQIQPEISARINQLYPNDQATGFSKGDIRGAFSVVKVLD